MMNDFNFDLQRFEDEEEQQQQSTITIKGNQSSVVTLAGSKTLTIGAGTDKDLVVSLSSDQKYAVVSLASASDYFLLNGTKHGLTSVGTSQSSGEGITFSLGSSSAIVGGIDSGDIFYVGNEQFSMTTGGLFAGTNNTADKVYLNSSASSVTLNNTSVPADLSSNWDKIIAVNGNTLSIDDLSDFNTESHNGIIASNTDVSKFTKYASLNSGNVYFISSVDDAASLSHISLTSGLMSSVDGKGIVIDDKFAGTATTLPYIEVGNTTVKVNSATADFNVSGGYGSIFASVGSEAGEVSLISGSLVTSNKTQTISAGSYKLTGYENTNTNKYDGINIQSGTTGDVTLGDIDVGESFILVNGSGSAVNYTMTALGLIKEGENRPLVYSDKVLTAGDLSVSQIINAKEYTASLYSIATDAVITVSTVNADANNPTLIAYNNDAIASLKYGGNGQFSLSSPYDYADSLLPGNWKGISLASDVTLNLSKEFTGDGSSAGPLRIARGNSTFGIVSFNGNATNYVTLSGSDNNLDNYSISEIYLEDGSINAYSDQNGTQRITLHNANDIITSLGNSSLQIGSTVVNNETLTTLKGTSGMSARVGRGNYNSASTITIDSAGRTKTTSNVIVDSSSSNSIVANQIRTDGYSGSITFIYGKDSGFALTDMKNGEKIDLTISGIGSTCEVQNGKLVLYSGSQDTPDRKIWYDSDKGYNYSVGVAEEYSIAGISSFKDIITSNSSLTISSDYSSSVSSVSMAGGASRPIFGIDSSNGINVSIDYGTLSIASDRDAYELKNSSESNSLTSVLINDTARSVKFDGNFVGTQIRVPFSQSKITTFQSKTKGDFTVSLKTVNSNNIVHVAGASSVSLSSGTLYTNEYTQTILAGDNYSIASDSASTVKDGIIVKMERINDVTNYIIDDIDFGESFYVGKDKYTRNLIGFTKGGDSSGAIYSPTLSNGSYEETSTAVAVEIDGLKSATASTVIAATSASSTYYGATKNIFAIGGEHSLSAIVVDDAKNPSARHATLRPLDNSTYYLDTVASSADWTGLDIISVMGAETTINNSLLQNNNAIIVADKSQAVFKVDSVSNKGIFNVNGQTASAPTIGGATALTLLDGSITATTLSGGIAGRQTIRNGENSNSSLIAQTSVKVAYSKTDSKGTIYGANENEFLLANNAATNTVGVTSGNGVDFIVDTSGSVTISNFGDSTTDAFYYGDSSYSIKGVGLVKTSGNNNYLWNKDDSHSMVAGNSIAMADLQNTAYWSNLARVSNNTATISSNLSTPITFIDSQFSDTYGTLEKSGSTYRLKKSDEDGLSFTSITIANGVNNVYFDDDFLNTTIKAPHTTLQALTATSTNDTYQVSISSSGLMSLAGVSTAALMSGSMIADSNIGVEVESTSIKSTDGNITLRATGDSPAAVALTLTSAFKTDDHSYQLGKLGLSRDGEKYLPQGTNTGYTVADNGSATVNIANITSDSYWAGIIAPEDSVLSVDSSIGEDPLIVVDKVNGPDYQFANLTKDTDGIYVMGTVSGSATSLWPDDYTISVSDSSLSIASYFRSKTIAGKNSGVTFYFADTSGYALIGDGTNGATISGVNDIHQSAGTLFANNTEQTISTPDSYKIRYSSGNGIGVVIDDSKASISSLNSGDIFYVGDNRYTMSSNSRLRTSNNTKILKASVNGSLSVADIDNPDDNEKWSKIVTANGEGVFTANSANFNDSLSNGESALVIGTGDTIYGELTRATSGDGYSLSYDTSTATKNASLTAISVLQNDIPVTLSSDFIKVPVWADTTATFRAASLTGNNFVVDNSDSLGVAVTGAPSISLGSGTIKVSTTDQTIKAGSYNIYGLSSASSVSADDIILVTYTGTNASVGGLDTGEQFGIGNYTYVVTPVGLIRNDSSTKKLCEASGFKDNDGENGVFKVGSAFNTDIIGLTDGVLDLSGQKSAAAVVDNVDIPTLRIANLSLVSDQFSLLGEGYQEQIKTVNLGTNNISLNTDFETTITTDNVVKTFTINNDTYKASSALTIHSGDSENTSYLMKGMVSLDSSANKSVKTARNTVSVATGGIYVNAAGTSVVTLSGLGKDDKFSIDDTSYTYTSAGLFKEGKIYKESITSVVATDLADNSNWLDIIAVNSDGVLAIAPTLTSDNNEWIILNSDLDKKCGTLKAATGGYSIFADTWGNDTISVKDTTVYFPNVFDGEIIKGDSSDALFKVTNYNTAFTVTDGADGATIGDATQISMESGTIALSGSGQTVVTATATKYSVAVSTLGASEDGITVIMDKNGASLGSLNNTKDNEDKFTINGRTFVMLPNGRISRSDNKYWLSTAITDGGTVPIGNLMSDDNEYWGGFITISGGLLTIDSNTMNSSLNSALVVDESDSEKIYGKLLRDENGYTLDSSDTNTNVNATLNGITLDKTAQPVTFTKNYLEIPITAGNTVFEATTAADSSFTVNYTSASLGTNATGVDLKKGSWSLSNAIQTLTADGQTIQAGSASTAVSVSYDGTNAVTVAGLDNTGEAVNINDETYSIVGGNGITLNIADNTPTIAGISNGDKFAVGSDVFSKNANGFVKSNGSDNYLWQAGDVTGGISLSQLNEVDDNWLAVATVDNKIVINTSSKSVAFIDSTENLSSIYGALSTEDGYNLSNISDSIQANAKPSLIAVEDVVAGLSSYYSKVTISGARVAGGAVRRRRGRIVRCGLQKSPLGGGLFL